MTLLWGARDIHLYFNQHYTYAPGAFCYALSTAGTSTATGQESSTYKVWPYREEEEEEEEEEQLAYNILVTKLQLSRAQMYK